MNELLYFVSKIEIKIFIHGEFLAFVLHRVHSTPWRLLTNVLVSKHQPNGSAAIVMYVSVRALFYSIIGFKRPVLAEYQSRFNAPDCTTSMKFLMG